MRSLIIPLFFLTLPLAEIATFVLVGREVGVWTTLLLVLLSGVVGAVLLRVQGLGVMKRLRETTGRGVDPGRELVHGVMIVIAAFLLIIPGFLSDTLGLLLFIPAVREVTWKAIKNRMTIVSMSAGGGFRRGPDTSPGMGPATGTNTATGAFTRSNPKVIDLDEDEFSHDDPQRPPSDDKDRLR
ncbi:FxsA family protein [Pararhizobium antarcticum]|uniref:Exclusion suppressor FxsA n=1 Tax=Pararhizobium antarcticum TaxID=1798805 RepID=A0A657LU39_9HYPH|nr:FxsA family protein [Pararhizobium antarcticum]OJF98376.1 hypothetical protein AX760_14085 [Pararhizobium antarcticum]OJG01106.1 hypothetical protein AX761_00325 [Rhizobium sp. 58]